MSFTNQRRKLVNCDNCDYYRNRNINLKNLITIAFPDASQKNKSQTPAQGSF